MAMHLFDDVCEKSARLLAKRTSRRSMLGTIGRMLTGAALMPLLPIDRTARAQSPPAPGPVANPTKEEQSCDYWKYCAIDGFLCACCGGTSTSCPPGTQASPITWIGTCHNPADGRDYIVSYNDCCGKVSCGDCFCNRNQDEKPMYRLSRNNDVNWCMANTESNYHCSVSVILGATGK
jgi:methylamine dehydrogenase light chain